MVYRWDICGKFIFVYEIQANGGGRKELNYNCKWDSLCIEVENASLHRFMYSTTRNMKMLQLFIKRGPMDPLCACRLLCLLPVAFDSVCADLRVHRDSHISPIENNLEDKWIFNNLTFAWRHKDVDYVMKNNRSMDFTRIPWNDWIWLLGNYRPNRF